MYHVCRCDGPRRQGGRHRDGLHHGLSNIIGTAFDSASDDADTGEMILKRMANVADGPSRCYNAAKPVGMYCYATTAANLTPCFSRLASAILRISK